MATTYSWGYTNTTASLVAPTMAKVGEYSNYGLKRLEPEMCVLKNRTSPIDQLETIAVQGKQENINFSSKDWELANPPKSNAGLYYGVNVRAIRRETRDDGTVIDHPISCAIKFKHDTSHNWSDTELLEVLGRSLGAMYNETSSSWRFQDMARQCLAPTQD